MSRREIVILTDDIDGSDNGVRTVAFSLDGTTYTIDLSEANHARFAAALSPFVAAARKLVDRPGTGKTAGKRSAAANNTEFNLRVRAWSAEQGTPVAERGRVPQSAVDAYLAAGRH